MSDASITEVQSSYDRVAEEYVRRIFDELQHKPLDRRLLDRFADSVRDLGTACDIGCGPGQVARYLHERGARVCGVDLSAEMVGHARRLNPGIEFHQASMLKLPVADGTWAGLAAFYSIIHVPRVDVVAALRELRRTVQPGGLLLLAFHIGDDTVQLEEWWGHPVNIDFNFFRAEEMQGHLQTAGWEAIEVIERDPYPEVEHPSRRAYIFARKPVSATGSAVSSAAPG